jgi:hypothetical protein
MPNFDELVDFSAPTQDLELNIPVQEDDEEVYGFEGNQESSEDDIFNGSDTQTEETSVEEEGDYMSRFLRSKGFNPNEIKIQNEYGEEEVISFNDLSDDEKLQILSMPDVDLTDEEINMINFFRSNNTTLQQVIEAREKLAVENALKNKETSFVVDQATDEQLMMAELKSKYPSFSQEELEEELEKELESPTFSKKVALLREQYKQLEEENNLEESKRIEQEREANYQQTYYALLNVAQQTDDLAGIELEDNDKEDVLRFLLERDVNGQSEFYKLLNNPKTLFDVAWYALKGNEAINMIHQYYRKEIETSRKANRQVDSPSGNVRVKTKSAANSNDDKYDLAGYLK